MPAIAELITYPVKGCAGRPQPRAALARTGLAHDRAFLVVDGDGVFRTQRNEPRLAVITPEVGADGRELTLSAPGTEPLRLDVDTASPPRPVELFGAAHQGIDQGDTVARWLSEVLGAERRLVRVPPEYERTTDGLVPGRSLYADSGSLHVLSRASLGELNRRIVAAGREPLPLSRFRPNIVLDGWAEPHLEDQARHVTAGGTELAFAKLAVRCAVTLVDQERGERAGPEPLRTLATYRRVPEGKGVSLGAKYTVLRTGELAVGDEFAVREWAVEKPGDAADRAG
ncbi:MOSC domain-containing protein [Streptomyces sp. NPDC059009]|uniref:MOSC domain-containing protein n=1 Tax=Streptomyces sp. NPDC059009 TaxID=3346694 RepID=UPI003677D4B5